MSKYPNDNDLDNLERKILKYLWNNVSVDLSIRNSEKREQEMYRKFSTATARMFRKCAMKLVMDMVNFAENEVQDER